MKWPRLPLPIQAGLAGFAGIGLQMLSYRIMTLIVGDSSFIFALVLGVFVLMIALGAWLSSTLNQGRQLFILTLIAYLNVLGLIAVTPLLPEFAASLLKPLLTLEWNIFWFHLALIPFTLVLVGPAALCLAAVTPYLARIQSQRPDQIGWSIGRLWAANSIGCLLGTAFFGVFFFWVFGLKWTLILLALSIVTLAYSFETKSLILVLGLAWIPFFQWNLESLIHSEIQSGRVGWPDSGYKVIDYEDSPLGSFAMAAFDRNGQTAHRLVANGRFDASSLSRHEYASRMVVTLPLLFLSGENQKAAMIGLGGGRSLDAMVRSPEINDIQLFEIVPSVVKFQRHFFPEADNPLNSPKVKLHVLDAYVAFDKPKEDYDIISSEPSQLWASGVAPLYSHEYNQKVAAALKPGGIYAQWIPSYAISQSLFDDLLETWTASFPFRRAFYWQGDLILLGSKTQFQERDERARNILDSSYRRLEVDFSKLQKAKGNLLSVDSTYLETKAWADHLAGEDLRLWSRDDLKSDSSHKFPKDSQ